MSNIPPLGQPTGMMPGAGPSKFKPIDPLRVLRANWLWVSLSVVLGVILGGGAWFMANKYMAKYTSGAQFNVQANEINIQITGSSSTPVRMDQLEPLILREVQTILAEPTLRQILNKPAVQNTQWFKKFGNNLDNAFAELDKEVIRASHIRETPLFNVSATTEYATDSQIILEALSEEYIRLKDLAMNAESAQALLAAQNRRDTAEQRIASITVQIKRFMDTNPMEAQEEGRTQAALRVTTIVRELQELNQSLISLQATYNQLLARQQEGRFEASDEERQIIEQGREILDIDAQLLQLRIQLQPLADKFKPEHPAIRSIEQQILALERERAAEFDSQARVLFNAKLEQAANGVQILNEEVSKATESLNEWTLRRQDYVRLKQELDTLNRGLAQAEDERDDATKEIAKLRQIDQNKARVVVEEYVPPQKAKQSFPPEPYIMIPGIALLITGLATGLIFLRELMDQRVRSAQDVKMITDASLIGMIPNADQDPGKSKSVDRVVEQNPIGLLAESFRQVRTAVLSKIDRRGYKTLMLVSAKPNAGVTTAAQNLAASCALSGRRVLIIDANFRRPGMAKLMGMAGQPGLSDLLCGDQEIEQASSLVQASKTSGLSLLPAGDSANAAVELFENPRFRDLLARLESEYDLLVIDAPPALLTSDAQLLSRHVDAMVLVSRAQSDTRGMLQRLYRELDGQRADILGIVLNGVQASVGGYLKQNFREFHDYSGPERRRSARPAKASANGAAASQPTAPVCLDDIDLDDDSDTTGR